MGLEGSIMVFVSEFEGYALLALFGVAMLLITWFFTRKNNATGAGFLVAGRKISWIIGAPSIAASWLWAPALFISVQVSYEMGLPGLFWFTFPNILALALFYFLAPKIRELLPEGYTLPQWIKYRLADEKVHKVYMFPFFLYQLMAVAVQLFVGGNLVSIITGIPLEISMVLLGVIGLSYSLISGLKASMITDYVQLGVIFLGLIIVVPLALGSAGGITVMNLGGLANNTNIFDPVVAFSYGIVTSIGLIAGAVSDQQYWQRSFAIKKNELKKSFIVGALLFGIIPIALSTLGFLAANPLLGISLPAGVDASMIGVATVANLVSPVILLIFVVMLLAGLSSTLDSGLIAGASLYTVDWKNETNDKKAIKTARLSMVGFTIAGLLVGFLVINIEGFGLAQLWWIFNTIAASVLVPTILSLYWNKLSAKGVFWGVTISFIIGIPLFVYGNIIGNTLLIVASSLYVVGISTVFCYLYANKTAWVPPMEKTKIKFKLST